MGASFSANRWRKKLCTKPLAFCKANTAISIASTIATSYFFVSRYVRTDHSATINIFFSTKIPHQGFKLRTAHDWFNPVKTGYAHKDPVSMFGTRLFHECEIKPDGLTT